MANASIGGYTLDIDPSSAQWTYTLRTKSIDTYGGRVIQVLGCSIDSLAISGYLPPVKGGDSARWTKMEEFETKIRAIMQEQADSKSSVTFNYPVLDWNGKVFLTGYENVKYDVKTTAISYTLSFQVDSGFGAIKTAASSEGLDVIPDGVDWVRDVYNTPTASWDDVEKAFKEVMDSAGTSIETESLYDYLSEITAIESKITSNSSDTSSDDSSSSDSTDSSSISSTTSSTDSFWSTWFGDAANILDEAATGLATL